jgi:hypothetical protein
MASSGFYEFHLLHGLPASLLLLGLYQRACFSAHRWLSSIRFHMVAQERLSIGNILFVYTSGFYFKCSSNSTTHILEFLYRYQDLSADFSDAYKLINCSVGGLPTIRTTSEPGGTRDFISGLKSYVSFKV